MGRLSKSKIDQLQKLRKKGYLQKEVAEMLGVNIKTVRTYDPLRRAPESEIKPVQKLSGYIPPNSLLSDIRSLADWITLLYLFLSDPNQIPCPHCLFPTPPSAKKKTKTVILRMLENGDYKCPECGNILASPPNLSWRLLVTEVEEEVRSEGRLPAKGEAES